MYTTAKVLPTTQQIELVGRKEFVAVTLDPKDEIFVVYVTTLTSFSSDVYLFQQIYIAILKIEEISIAIPNKYIDFADVFSPDLSAEFIEYIRINNYAINFIDDKQLPHEPIYSVKRV